MAIYSRTRFHQLKKEYGYDYVLLQDDYEKYWTYDDDACALASWLNISVNKNARGEAFLVFDDDDLSSYSLEEIDGEEGAFFLPTENESLPSSALLKVDLLSDNGARTIIIVSDTNEQDTKNGIYWEGRGLAKAIFQAIDAKDEIFNFKNEDYFLESVYFTEQFEKRTHRYYFLKAESTPRTLFVYQKKSYTNENGLEPVTALFYYPESSEPAEMTVFYSPSTGEYFVNQEEFNLFRRQHGLPYVALNIAKGEKFPSNPDMAEESILHLYGYNVSSAEGLSDHERQTILARLMDYNIATKGKIENHLEIMIYLGEKNPIMVNAVEKWRRDLLFTYTYKCVDQRKVWISGVKYK